MASTLNGVTERIRKYAHAAEKKERYAHSVRVAVTAKKLCRKFDVDDEKGYLAGMAHDICKDMDKHFLLKTVVSDGFAITRLERERPSLLHGRAAAMVLLHHFEIMDEEILEAVRWHTFGKKGMSKLAKVVYAADKIEPGRAHVTDCYLEDLQNLSLDQLVAFLVKESLKWVEAKEKEVSPQTLEFLASLENE